MKRNLIAPLCALLAVLGPLVILPPPTDAAQLRIFEAVEPPFTDGPLIYKNQDVAQSFTPAADYRLERVQVMVDDLDFTRPVDPLDLSIQTEAAGEPSGTVLATGRADGDPGYAWLSFDLTPAVNVTAAAAYWIVLQDKNNKGRTEGYQWAKKPGDTYAGGIYGVRSGGSWTTVPAEDLLFRTWGILGPVIAAGISVDSPTAGAWDPLVYTVHFNNTGTQSAPLVWTNLTLSPNTTYDSDTAGAVGGIAMGPTAWLFANAPVGPHSFRVSVHVNPGVRDGRPLDTVVQVEYTNSGGQMQELTQATVRVIARSPSLTLLKGAVPTFVNPDENLTYAITITNTGSRPSSRVWVNDTLPTEVVYLGDTAGLLANYSGEWFDGSTLRVNFTNLPRGTFSFNVSVRTRPGLLNGTAFQNTVTAEFTDIRGLTVTPPSSASATARIHGASIAVTKRVNVDATGPGQDVLYTIRYDNQGDATAARVWINDTLPPEVDYVSDSGGGTVNGSAVRFAFSIVSVGNHFVLISARVRPGIPNGRVARNAVELSYTDSDSAPLAGSSAFAEFLVIKPSIAVALSGGLFADPGDLWDLRVTVANTGNASAAELWVNRTLSPGLTYVLDDAASRGGTPTAMGWYFTNVVPGAFSFLVRLRVAVGLSNGTTLDSRLGADYRDRQGLLAQSVPVTRILVVVTPVFDLALLLDRSLVVAGESAVLRVRYANTGPGVASDVWINATLPDGMTVAAASDPWVATTGVRYTWHAQNVGMESRELRITLRLVSAAREAQAGVAVRLEFADANGNSVGERSELASFAIRGPGWSLQTWGLLALLATVAFLSTFLGYKVYGVGTRNKAQIHQLFLLHKNGLLIRHYSRDLRGDLDTDVLGGMLVAVQNFVRESFQFRKGDLDEMKFGQYKILLMHGQHVILAAVLTGQYLERMKSVLTLAVERLEQDFGEKFQDWSGAMADFDGMDALMDPVLRGRAPDRAANAPRNGGGGRPPPIGA